MSGKRRELHLNAFLMEAGHHEAAWRLPESNPRADLDIQHWIRLARLAEAAKFDSIFLADGQAIWRSAEFRPAGQLEPLTLLTVLSQATSRIGLIATASSTYNEPYSLARRFAALDHVSGGRAGWNIVTSASPEEAANFGLDDRPGHALRYARADEFLTVAKALWDSWEAEAVIADKATGRYADPSRIHRLGHRGEHFSVAGPLNAERPPQGYPLLVQAGSSEDGKDFAARHAEAIFTAHQTFARAADFYADIKARARAAGRDPDGVIVLPGIVPVIGSTEAEARWPWPSAWMTCASPSTACTSSPASSSWRQPASTRTGRCQNRSLPARSWRARKAGPTLSSSSRCGRTSPCARSCPGWAAAAATSPSPGRRSRSPTRSWRGSRAARRTASTS